MSVLSIGFDEVKCTASIKWIHVQENMRNRGIGTCLLLEAAYEAMSKGCRTITLDDVSDGHRTSANIYLRCGFLYDDPDGGPEMTGRSASIISRVKRNGISRVNVSKRKHGKLTILEFECRDK